MSKWMRNRRSQMSLAVLVLAAGAGSMLVAGAGAGAAEEEKEDKPPIVQHMEEINRNYKLLRRSARRPDRLVSDRGRGRSLDMVIKMQTHMLKAMHEDVPEIQKAPEKKREKLSIRFKKIQADLVKELLDLEIALLERDAEQAKKILDNMAALKEKGHDEFVPGD